MSSKMQFQVFFGDYNVLYGPNGVDISAFKCTSSVINKSLQRSFWFHMSRSRVESNDSSWSTFVGCQGVACRAVMIGSPRCNRGWTNGNRLTSTWSIQQDHTQT